MILTFGQHEVSEPAAEDRTKHGHHPWHHIEHPALKQRQNFDISTKSSMKSELIHASTQIQRYIHAK